MKISAPGLVWMTLLAGSIGCMPQEPATIRDDPYLWPQLLENTIQSDSPNVRWLDIEGSGPNVQAIRPDGRMVALGSPYESIVYDLRTGKPLHAWSLPTHVVQFSRDGKSVLTRRKGEIGLWDAQTFQQLRNFPGNPPTWQETIHRSPPLAALSDDEDRIAISNSLQLFDVQQPSALLLYSSNGDLQDSLEVPEQATITSLQFLSGGRILLAYRNAIDGSHQVRYELWNSATGTLLREFEYGQVAKPSPSGELVATSSIVRGPHVSSANPAEPMRLEIWSAESGKRMTSIERPDPIRDFTFSADSERILVPIGNQLVEWNVNTGAELFASPASESLFSNVAYSPDGSLRLATIEVPNGVDDDVDHFLRAWDPKTNAAVEVADYYLDSYNGTERLFFFPEDGRFVDLAAEFAVRDLRSGETLQVAPKYRAPQQQANFSSDGRLYYVSNHLVDMATGRFRYWSLPGYNHAFISDGRAFSEGAGVFLSDIASGHMYWKLQLRFAAGYWDAGIARDGSRIVVVARLDDAPENARMLIIAPSHPDTPTMVSGFAFAVAVSPDGTQFVTASKSEVQLRDGISGEVTRNLWKPPGRTMFAVYDPAGTKVLLGGVVGHLDAGEPVDMDDEGWVALIDVEDNSVKRLEGHTAPVTAGDFSSDLQRCVSSSLDRTLRLWDVESAAELHVFRGHRGGVSDVAYSSLGDRILSAGLDGAALWDIAGVVDKSAEPSAYVDSLERIESINAWNGRSGKDSLPLFPDSSKPSNPAASNVDWSLVKIGETSRLSTLPDEWLTWAKDVKQIQPNPYAAEQGALSRYDLLHTSADASHRLYSSSASDQLIVTDASDKILSQFEARLRHREAALSSDGSRLTIVRLLKPRIDASGTGVYQATVYETKTGEALRTIDDIESWYVHSIKIDPRGETILLQIDNNSLELRDFQTGEQLAQLRRSPAGAGLVSAYSLDGRYVVTCKFPETVIRLRDPKTLQEVRAFGDQLPIRWFRLTPDGQHILVGQDYANEQMLLAKYELETGRRLWSRAAPVKEDGDFSPDGRYYLSKPGWYMWTLWDVEAGQLRCVVVGEASADNNQPVFVAETKTLHLGSPDGKLLWSEGSR